MSEVLALLAEARSLGVRLWADKGKLRYQAAAGMMSPEFIARLGTNKQAVLDCLAPPRPP